MPMDEHEKLARSTAAGSEAITGFYIHLTVFVLVMKLLLVINLTFLDDFWWDCSGR